MNGIILINKEEGMTSHDVVSALRKILRTRTIGHAGTLDPLATGVLPLMVNAGTKVSKYLMDHDKEYIAVIKLGIKTDTADITGKIIEEDDFNQEPEVNKVTTKRKITQEFIETILNSFLGKSKQVPPMYSAIKVNGKKLYEYAREGTTIEREHRDIEIYDINLINWNMEEKEITIKVKCSKGTFIRTLAEDISQKLGTIGTIKKLNRTVVGEFSITEAISLKELEKLKLEEIQSKYIMSIENIFKHKEKIILENERKLQLFLNGVMLTYRYEDELYRIYDSKDKFIGLGIIKDNLLKRDICL